MANFHDPTVISHEYLALIKLWHTLGGLYIWEFLTTLNYEWNVIQGHRPYGWTIWIYSFTRVATLVAVILSMVGLHTVGPINCQAWVISTFVFGYLALSSSLLLIVLRTIAIWDKNKVVIILTASTWGLHLAFLIQGISQLHSAWLPRIDACMLPNMESEKLAVVIMLVTDIVLVLTMLLGLLRWKRRGGGMFELGRLLWKQGIVWLFFATGAGFTTVVFVYLDLNSIFDIMFVMPALITLSITATRIYTSLADFVSSTDIMVDSDLERRRRNVSNFSNAKQIPVVHVTCEQYSTSQSGISYLEMSGQQCHKPQGQNIYGHL